jgi:hypothetical protein
MSFTLDTFASLSKNYATWPEVKAYLESKDGGELRVVEQEQNGVAVIRYDKLVKTTVDVAQYRSVVWDISNNTPLCVAPFRAVEGAPPVNTPFSSVEDFVDGFMMNAWLYNDVLQVATRTRVGGDNTFYSEKTFGQLFDECLENTSLKNRDGLKKCLEGLRSAENASSAFVSFVVQHPEHRIVAKAPSPILFTVHTGCVMADRTVRISERSVHWPQELSALRIGTYGQKSFEKDDEVEVLLRNTAAQRGWRWQGLVFKDGKGRRWRMRTPTYTLLRQLRGSESSTLERFFRLRAQRKVVDYLKHYKEDSDEFWSYEEVLRARTADVFSAYVDVHKAHAVKFKELPEQIRPAVFLLHTKWREQLRPKGFYVRLQNVIEVVNALRPFEKKRLMDMAPYVAVAKSNRNTPLEADVEIEVNAGEEWGGEVAEDA